MLKEYVIITAGGSGLRMNTEIPKQFMDLSGTPVIIHTIRTFINYSNDIKLIVVLPEDHLNSWNKLIKKYPIHLEYEICSGGETRFDSVKNGLELVDDEVLVAVHDAVRPLVSVKLISDCFLLAAKQGNAVPAISLTDSAREVMGDDSKPADRGRIRLVQTPQVFRASQLKQAYQQAYRTSFTDDATVVEALGIKIHLVDGEKKNLKITNKEDLRIAEAYL